MKEKRNTVKALAAATFLVCSTPDATAASTYDLSAAFARTGGAKAGVCERIRRKSPRVAAACMVTAYGARKAADVAEYYGYYELAKAIRALFVDDEGSNQN